MTIKKPRNYAATESTLINVRALKKRVTALERARVSHIAGMMSLLRRILALEQLSRKAQ